MSKYVAPVMTQIEIALNERICVTCELPNVEVGDSIDLSSGKPSGLVITNIGETVPAES